MIKAIVTDIEGTTSSISFVHEVLFPYASEHIEAFVSENAGRPDVSEQLDEVARLSGVTRSDVSSLVDQLKNWIAEDKKVTPLKAIQGMLWKTGYENGDFQGHIYDDAYACLKQWFEQGVALYVYSSGSVAAQKLLFGHTKHGDLNGLFKGNFDTLVGGKKESASYRNILAELGVPAEQVLFLSDIKEELDAANEAGMKVCWLIRESEIPENASYKAVSSFTQIDLETF